MDNVLKLYADFEDGKLVIERQDGKPIDFAVQSNHECIEVVEFGSKGDAVKAVQALLNLHGWHLEVDGIFGNLTQNATIIFQEDHGITSQQGVVMADTWNALIGV